MVYKYCKKCGKRYYKSPYDRSKYRIYCNPCGIKVFEEEEEAKEEQKMVQFNEATTSYSTMSTGCRNLRRTDNEEDYLDSTRCEYSKTEVEEMKLQLQQLMFRKSNLKQTIRKLYDNINQCDEKIEKLKCKLAIAEREQQLRKKLRRETRELIPTLENVQKQTTNVYRSINDLLNEDDNDCITIKDELNN
jgi:predicted nuclease with TOPRIM domain